jgi:hypothetical protein
MDRSVVIKGQRWSSGVGARMRQHLDPNLYSTCRAAGTLTSQGRHGGTGFEGSRDITPNLSV